MAARHPGKWKPVFVTPEPGQQPNVVLDTEQIASHACLIYNQNTKKWKVLYGWPVYPEGPNSKVRTRIWDPNTNTISTQEIPDWPGGISQPSIFCGVHGRPVRNSEHCLNQTP